MAYNNDISSGGINEDLVATWLHLQNSQVGKATAKPSGRGKASWPFEDKREFCLKKCMDIIILRSDINGKY